MFYFIKYWQILPLSFDWSSIRDSETVSITWSIFVKDFEEIPTLILISDLLTLEVSFSPIAQRAPPGHPKRSEVQCLAQERAHVEPEIEQTITQSMDSSALRQKPSQCYNKMSQLRLTWLELNWPNHIKTSKIRFDGTVTRSRDQRPEDRESWRGQRRGPGQWDGWTEWGMRNSEERSETAEKWVGGCHFLC